MSKANSDIDPLHKEVICPVLLQLAENTVEIPLQNVIDQLADYIVEETDQSATFDKVKSLWMKRFSQSAKLMDIVLVKENACWESVFKRINEKASNSNNNDHNNSNTSSSFSSSTSTLKHLLTEEDKTNIKEMFNALDPAKFWYLKATCDQAAKDNVNPESVEEKMKRFALECVYHHPCQSLILDLDDNHWNDVFSEDELIELHEYGKPVLRSLPQDLTTQLECIAQLVSG